MTPYRTLFPVINDHNCFCNLFIGGYGRDEFVGKYGKTVTINKLGIIN